ncbi:MAG: cyclic pyranopterin phosphate synthase MoaA [Firmicutes bacterium ZCTH02-B6]|nr:MAG: cyclic pyranopterin phosphate synthase MoaA [Firmicutes bacterium ZCTH02-B6]
MLVDRFGRRARKLRISVTDRCNFRCVYCMPEEAEFKDRAELLTYEEIERVTRVAVQLGIEKVRLTGGEPLVRRDVERLVERLVSIPGLRAVSMTTNGYFLPAKAAALKRAGLSGINISLDTLDRDRFVLLTRRDYLREVLAGIGAAVAAGLEPVKVNMVVMRGYNDDEVETFAAQARSRALVVRFIEFMPLDNGSVWNESLVVPAHEIIARVQAVAPLEPVEHDKSDPARRWRFKDGQGEIGVIASVTEPFCGHCDRLRLTADGKLRNCLFALDEYDVRAVLRGGGSDADIAAVFSEAVANKWAGHLINREGFVKPERTMHAIGG